MLAGLLDDLEFQANGGTGPPPSSEVDPGAWAPPVFDTQVALLRPLLPAVQHITLRLVPDYTEDRRLERERWKRCRAVCRAADACLPRLHVRQVEALLTRNKYIWTAAVAICTLHNDGFATFLAPPYLPGLPHVPTQRTLGHTRASGLES